MTNAFLNTLNLSLSAGYLIAAILVARLLLKKAPRWIHVLLWALVAVRLMLPFSLESILSLIPKAEVVNPQILMDPVPAIDTGIPAVNQAVNPMLSEAFAPSPGDSANPLQVYVPLLAVLWILGMAAMAEYALFTWGRLSRQVRSAVQAAKGIYFSKTISTPFVLGMFRPRIYLPYGMQEHDLRHVLAHEKCHIRRRDHWWKPLGFALLSIHWFNPMLWLAYLLLCRDIELACDEAVIRKLSPELRADYSQALLNCTIRSKLVTACPVAFGEVGVKERVRNVLRYRKPRFWVVLIALAICLAVAVCFLTVPPEEAEASQSSPEETVPPTQSPEASSLFFHGVSLTVEEVSPTGVTVLFQQTGDPPHGRLLGGNDYALLQVRDDGTLETLLSVPEASFTFTSYDIANLRRHTIDWQWLYGALPPGNYRVGKTVSLQKGTDDMEQGIVWADFTIGQYDTGSVYEFFNVAPLEDIPDTYTLEEAAIDHVVTIIDADVTDNPSVWQDFLNQTQRSQPAWVRLIHCWWEPEYTKTLYDLTFDGSGYLLSWMEEGRRVTERYQHLRYFGGEAGPEDPFDIYHYYVLTDRSDATWEELLTGTIPGSPPEYRLIYMDVLYHPKQPPLPYAAAAQLHAGDRVLKTFDDYRTIHELWHKMQQSIYLGYEPKTFCEGPRLVFTAEDGSTHIVTLSLDGDLILYKGLYYDFEPGTDESGSLNGLPWLLDKLGYGEDWPQEVKDAYPDFFAPVQDYAPPRNDLFASHLGESLTITVCYPDGREIAVSEANSQMLLEVLSETELLPAKKIQTPPQEQYTLSVTFADGSSCQIRDLGDGAFLLYDANGKLLYSFTKHYLDNAVAHAVEDSQ